jgi:hypothetical protein
MKKRLSFTAKNVISSFSAVTGLPANRLFIEEKVKPSAMVCEVFVEGPVIGDRHLQEVSVYRDQKALDESAIADLSYDEHDGFSDVGDLSPEEVIRHAAKGCTLSDLRHWIIAKGRDEQLDDDQIKERLKHPLEMLIEHYQINPDLDGAFSTLMNQCRSDLRQMARYLIAGAGGAQKIWKDELYETLPGGFIAHIIPDEDISLFRQLLNRQAKSKQVRRDKDKV